MAIDLVTEFEGSQTYEQDLDNNFTILENSVNDLLNTLGATLGTNLAVPVGLQEIFDRDGVIGKDSYRFAEGNLGGNLLPVPKGAIWISASFRAQDATVNVDLTGLASGTLYLNVDSSGAPSANVSQSANSIYSFFWDLGSTTVSNRVLLVDILFDGDDYNDSLSSTALSQTYESMAERFEDIENRLGILGSFYMEDPDNHSFFNFAFKAGRVRNDTVVSDTASGTVLLLSVQTNYVQVNPSTGVVTANTTGFTTNFIPLFEVLTDAIQITTVTDRRTWASLGGGGGGGGHTQNTDTGTTSSTFDLLFGQPSGSSNAGFGVDRGSDPRVEVRWNEATNEWEFTNNGVDYFPIGNLNLGVQELSKVVNLENPTLILSAAGIGTSASYVLVDITGASELLDAAQFGVSGLILRVIYYDDAASGTTNVKFRKPINPAVSPATAFNVQAFTTGDAQQDKLSTIIIEGEGVDASGTLHQGFEYFATTSGSNTGHLFVYLTGYFARVTGVGTQDKDYTAASLTVAASTEVDFNIPQFVNRALVHKFRVEEISGNPVAGYDLKLYSKDTFVASSLLYQVDSISPSTPYEDFMPTWVQDDDETSELHLQINNTDGSNTGVYTVTIDMEQFA